MINDLVENNVVTFDEVAQEFEYIGERTKECFDAASAETKIQTRDEVIKHNSQPLAKLPSSRLHEVPTDEKGNPVFRKFFVTSFGLDESGPARPNVMRKHMTECWTILSKRFRFILEL